MFLEQVQLSRGAYGGDPQFRKCCRMSVRLPETLQCCVSLILRMLLRQLS